MVAVFAIIGILSSLAFIGGRAGDRSLALERSAHQVAQHIRKAGELAFGAELSAICGTFSGYGVYFDANTPDRYILYGNCNGSDGYRNNGPNPDQIVETFLLDPAVEIGSVSDGGAWSVAFFPPEPRIALCASDACSTSLATASLTLRVKSDTSNTRVITINEKGTIDID